MKLTLSNKDIIAHFFNSASILGVMGSLKDYQFNWYLNEYLGFQFRMNNEIVITTELKGRKYYFPVYEYKETYTATNHYIYTNKADGQPLLPECKHFDFIWLLKTETNIEHKAASLLVSIKSIPFIQLVSVLQFDKLPNKENLVF